MPGVQALFVFGLGQGPAVVTKNYRSSSASSCRCTSRTASRPRSTSSSPATAAEGVRLPAAALLVADKLPASDPQKAVVVGYRKAYTERYKEDISTFGGHAYDALMIAVDAIKRAGSTDKAKVRDAIEETKGYRRHRRRRQHVARPTTWAWTSRHSACSRSGTATGPWRSSPAQCGAARPARRAIPFPPKHGDDPHDWRSSCSSSFPASRSARPTRWPRWASRSSTTPAA